MESSLIKQLVVKDIDPLAYNIKVRSRLIASLARLHYVLSSEAKMELEQYVEVYKNIQKQIDVLYNQIDELLPGDLLSRLSDDELLYLWRNLPTGYHKTEIAVRLTRKHKTLS